MSPEAKRHLANWRDEIDSAALYRALADVEGDARLAEVYRQLAATEERLAAYVIREHGRGRSVTEILEDPYLRNRTTEQQRARLLERPEVLRAIGEQTTAG